MVWGKMEYNSFSGQTQKEEELVKERRGQVLPPLPRPEMVDLYRRKNENVESKTEEGVLWALLIVLGATVGILVVILSHL